MLAVQANGKRRTRTRDSSITTAAPLLERSRDRIEIGEDERSQLAGSAFGELRDYYDVLVIERDTGHRVEEGLAVIVECYRPATPDAAILHIVRALGHLDDVADDPALPMDRTKIETYWKHRQPEIIRSLDWHAGRQTHHPEPPDPYLSR